MKQKRIDQTFIHYTNILNLILFFFVGIYLLSVSWVSLLMSESDKKKRDLDC